jgi:hypothetical protein
MKKFLLIALLLAGTAFAQGNKSVGSITEAGGASCGAPNGCVVLELPRNAGAASILITGTFVATLQFEKSVDGVTYVAANGIPQPAGGAVSSATATGTWAFDVPSFTFFRVRASAYTSGTAVVTMRTAELSGDGIDAVSGAVSPGTASATSLGGMPMICDTAASGTVTVGQAQMVRCTNSGVLASAITATVGDGATNANAYVLSDLLGTGANNAGLRTAPNIFNGTSWDHQRSAALANFTAATTLTGRNSIGAALAEKGSRWTVISNPAAGSQATASIAAEASVRHVVDCIAFSAASTTLRF